MRGIIDMETEKPAHQFNEDPSIITACRQVPFHACAAEDMYIRFRTDLNGLTRTQAEERLREYGRNVLPGKKAPSIVEVVLHQFKNPLIYVLLIAGIVSMAIGDLKDSIFIFAVIVLNAIIGTVQEWRAEQSAHALQSLLKMQARVRRGSETLVIAADEVVPGDIILLESGDNVPADMRLIQANNLGIDESFLTGESLPAHKNTAILASDVPVSDRINMAYAGGTVAAGRATGIVVGTGVHTEVGQIVDSLVEGKTAKPPLVIRMERFSQQVALVVLLFALILGTISVSRGVPVIDVFFLMVAMTVSAIPEGLPVAMTVALSLATSRMAQRHVIARKLVAVESLGSCTIIASDKTGTLTMNNQTVKLVVLPEGTRISIGGQGYNDEGRASLGDGREIDEQLNIRIVELARAAVLCNEASLTKGEDGWRHSGDSMDIAFLALGRKLGIDTEDRGSILAEIPFESEKRYAAVAYHHETGVYFAAKGALEALAPFCTHMRTSSGDVPIDYDTLEQRVREMAGEGYRVLVIAARLLHGNRDISSLEESDLKNLSILGVAGFIDPLRPEVRDAVRQAHDAGIKVVMITGDHPATALAIAQALELTHRDDQVITGAQIAELAAFDTPEFHELLRKITVFARVTPHQKLAIVEGLVTLGEFVAVTGDGFNDALALKRANIGVAMGSGTDIAKDAAQIIVTDDNFASIVNGIEEGRFAYSNVRKVTMLLISTGFAELVLLGTAILINMPAPFLAAQLLWLNLVTNGIQDVGLAFEAGEKGVMKLPPRPPAEGIFDRKMIENVLVSGLTMAIVCLAVWIYEIRSGMEIHEARNQLFTLLVLMQFFHVQNCRSESVSAFLVPIRNNRVLIIGMIIAFIVHLAAVYLPFTQSLLQIAPLTPERWLLLGALASFVIIVMEIFKWLRRAGR